VASRHAPTNKSLATSERSWPVLVKLICWLAGCDASHKATVASSLVGTTATAAATAAAAAAAAATAAKVTAIMGLLF
jgi:hypothetical protein